MLKVCICAAALALLNTAAHAVERYTEARIAQVETSDASIVVFLDSVTGDSPPIGNGGSNEAINKPHLFIANSATDIASRDHMLGSALLALSLGSMIRFRWEDAGANAGRVVVMLVRN